MFSIDHLGIAVKSLAAAKSIYQKLGLQVSAEETVEHEKVRLVMVPVGESRLELLEATGEDSTIAKFIAKRGEGLHHVCMRVPDLVAAVARLKADGVRLVSDEIKTGAGGHKYVFVHPSSAGGVLLELVQGVDPGKIKIFRPGFSRIMFRTLLRHFFMLLLAIDTSGRHGSLALARGRADGACDGMEVVALDGGMFSAQLVPQIAALLAKHSFSKNDLDGFVVASGPGSFTGLRVGLAAIKALAEVLVKPIAAVSLLEAVAVAAGIQGKVEAVLDAGRGELYAGEYDVAGDSGTMLWERILTRSEFATAVAGRPTITPDAALAEALRATGIVVTVVEPISAAAVAALGWRKIRAGETVPPEQLDANYVRRSDAEIFARSNS